jgi:hypothetical protein
LELSLTSKKPQPAVLKDFTRIIQAIILNQQDFVFFITS